MDHKEKLLAEFTSILNINVNYNPNDDKNTLDKKVIHIYMKQRFNYNCNRLFL